MLKKILKKYSIHIILILFMLNILQGFIIKSKAETEEKYKLFVENKIKFSISETVENTVRIQRMLGEWQKTKEISSKFLRRIAQWYEAMYVYSDNVRMIYNIYRNKENKNYSFMETHYFTNRANVIEDILDKEYENHNFNGNVDINKYTEQYEELLTFNSLFIESLKKNDSIKYYDDKLWPNDKFNDNDLYFKDFYYWNVFNDFFVLLEKEDFRNLYEIEED